MDNKRNMWSRNKYSRKCTLIFKTVKGVKRSEPQEQSEEQANSDCINEQITDMSENERPNIIGGNANE